MRLRIRLRAKLLLGVSLVLLPLLGLLLFSLEENLEMRRASLLNGLLQTANTSGLLVDASLQEAKRLAQTIAAEAASHHGSDLGALQGLLGRLARERPDLLNVAVFDPEGRPIASATPWPAGHDIADREYFQQALRTKQPAVSGLIVGRRVSQPSVVAAAPVLDEDRQARGVVTVSLRLDLLARSMLDIGMRPGQALFVTDPQGLLVFHTGRLESSWAERDLSGLSEVQQARAGDVVLTTDFQGLFRQDPRIAALTATPRHDWIVGVTWGTREAFEEMNRAHRQQVAAFITISLLVIAGAYTLATYLSGRASRLVAHAHALGRGEWAPIPPSRLGTGDELDELSHAFNHMAGELKRERERRETFIASVAHDLRNLTTPLSLTARLLGTSRNPTAESRERMLTRLRHQTTRIERLVSDLLDASRIDSGHFTLFPRRHDLMKLARDVIEEQQGGAGDHHLVLQGPGTLDVEADPDRLAQVLTNLVGNGIKYSPEGGEVTVTLAEAGGTVSVHVVDSGIGLQPQELEEVFEPYRRSREARTIRGLGLGLYICRAIVEAHGGQLLARSEGRGKGTTFMFTLPLRPGRRAAPPASPEDGQDGGSPSPSTSGLPVPP